MRRIQTIFLKPGMKIGLAVFNAEGIVLLQEGQILTQRFIDRLMLDEIPFVYVEDHDVPANVIMDIVSGQTRAEAVRTLREWIFNPGENKLLADKDSSRIIHFINNLVEELRVNPERCVKFLDIRAMDDFTFAHSVNVCILSLITGLSMDMTEEELLVLGLAALLHDIGKIMVSEKVLTKKGLYDVDDFMDMKKHPLYGCQLILEDPMINPLVAEIVYQHHERFNGTGYPRKLQGSQIHPCAYIIGAADVYDALTHDRTYRKKYLPHEAIEYLYGAGDHLFDYGIIENFVQHIALYPIGTVVELNNREQGTVIDVKPKLSARPIIRVHRDSNGNLLIYPKTIDLTEKRTLFIAKVIG